MLHIPVLLDDIVEHFAGIESQSPYFLDGTFGRGGHTCALLEKKSELKVVGIDQDLDAIEYGQRNFTELIEQKRLKLLHMNFEQVSEFKEKVLAASEGQKFCGILLDLGVSSPQLDEAERGFSFYHSGPLDMRMNQDQILDAAEIVNTFSKEELVEIFRHYGEIRSPHKVVDRIIEFRREKEFTTTEELSLLIEKADGWRKKGHHPATNYFLALRLVVNRELEVVENAIPHMMDLLDEGGRLFVITFHSLEDRITKNLFKDLKDQNVGFWVNKKVIQASWNEKKKNPRARSAKLRIFQKGVKEKAKNKYKKDSL